MRNFAPASPTPFPFPSAPSHLALTGRQSLCLILILSVSNHYSSLKAPQNLTANNHNEALKEGRRGRTWRVGTGCGTGVAPAIKVAASASVSTSGWVSSPLFALSLFGGCGWLVASASASASEPQPQPLAVRVAVVVAVCRLFDFCCCVSVFGSRAAKSTTVRNVNKTF